MEWYDEAIVLSARPHGESSAVVTLLTEGHGRHAGLVRGGQNPKNRAIYQAGNRVRAQWRARLADHLGSFTCEPLISHAARLFDDPQRLTALSAAAAVSERALPEREPDGHFDLPTLPQAALIYRLSGDYNPLHADPAVAKAAGFKAPILHGLCTFGVACHALVRTVCDGDPSRLRRQDVRFSSPVYPGETIRTEYWQDGRAVSYRARVLERDIVVLNNGYAEVT